MQQKRCAGCGETKPVSEFHKQKQQTDGYRPRCKVCRKAESEAWYTKHRDAIRERTKQWQTEHREEYLAYLKRWAAENRRHKQEYDRDYAASHTEERKEYHKRPEVRVKHRLNTRTQKARRRAQIGATVHPITAAEWDELKAKYRGCCAYCGKKEPNPTMDHVVALKKGGDHTVDNIVPSCGPCNRAKSTMSVVDFLASRKQGV